MVVGLVRFHPAEMLNLMLGFALLNPTYRPANKIINGGWTGEVPPSRNVEFDVGFRFAQPNLPTCQQNK
jgi:hypothetical protein